MIEIKAIAFGAATIVSTFIGGNIALRYKNFLKPLIAFCGGTLVAASILHLMPESLEILEDKGSTFVFGLILASFIAFHLIDKLVSLHGHSHEEDCETNHVSGLFPAVGLVIHSFLDGLIIGTGFLVDSTTGVLVATVVLLHDFSDGLNTVTLLLRGNHKTKTAYLFLIADAFAPMLGVIAAQIIHPSEVILGYVFCLFAGFFLYIGATDLLPEAHKERSSVRLVFFTILGALIVMIAKLFLEH